MKMTFDSFLFVDNNSMWIKKKLSIHIRIEIFSSFLPYQGLIGNTNNNYKLVTLWEFQKSPHPPKPNMKSAKEDYLKKPVFAFISADTVIVVIVVVSLRQSSEFSGRGGECILTSVLISTLTSVGFLLILSLFLIQVRGDYNTKLAPNDYGRKITFRLYGKGI
ncbi:hypothetical protein H8356DRAFT_1362999 [Neocallimastix lanati (nom. inval.)]|nr:hypothetical protein H8356DRAFT_1362999 [Neocallimastix sp. JGI-2020a]